MKDSAGPDRLVGVYSARLDKHLEDMLDEFDNFDYTRKPLLTQTEFEEEFLVIIGKLFRRRNKYQMIHKIFDKLISKSLNDQHKFLCLIDFMVNISRYDPAVFKDLPNDILATVAHTPIFSRVQDLIYNVGRMHYHFRKFTKQSSFKTANLVSQENSSKAPSADEGKPTESDNMDSGSESDKEPSNRIMDVSLKELTKKIMSKTKTVHKKSHKKGSGQIKKEILHQHDESILDNSASDQSDFSDYIGPRPKKFNLSDDDYSSDENDKPLLRRNQKRTTRNSSKSELENLVESESDTEYHTVDEIEETEEEILKDERKSIPIRKIKNQKLVVPGSQSLGTAQDESSGTERFQDGTEARELDRDDINITMNNTTSILEHNMDYREAENNTHRVRVPGSRRSTLASRISKTDNLIELGNGDAKSPTSLARALKRRKLGKTLENIHARTVKSRESKDKKQISPVRRKGFFVVESDLDFLYDGLERLKPSCNATLTKEAQKGFSYKPAQYSLLGNLPEKVTGVDPEVARLADSLLNTFIFQLGKRCAGNEIDLSQYVHPFEYDYIMENLESLIKSSTELPPLIFYRRFNSLFNYEGAVNSDISMLTIKETKVKGLRKLLVFETEDEYFNIFKKIVPRDKVASRIEFLNKLVTDGKSLYSFDFDDTVQALINNPLYMVDSEEEEKKILALQKAVVADVERHGTFAINELPEPSHETFEKEKPQESEQGHIQSNENAINNPDDRIAEQEKCPRDTTRLESGMTPDNSLSSKKMSNDDIDEIKVDDEGDQLKIVENSEKVLPCTQQQNLTKMEESNIRPLTPTNISEHELAVDIENCTKKDGKTISTDKKEDDTSIMVSKSSETLTQIGLEHKLREENAAKSKKQEKQQDKTINDDRNTVYCSSKGVRISTKNLKKVLSTKECFELLTALLFPKFKIDPTFSGISLSSLKSIGFAYDSLRPYLLSLFISDVFEFLRLPRYFKVDTMMFELQLQDLLKTANPSSKMKTVAFHA